MSRRTLAARSRQEIDHRADLIVRLQRVEGQLRGIQKMLASADPLEDCERVAQQMAAARKALDRAFFVMLGCALEQRGHAIRDADDIAPGFEEIAGLIARYA